MNLSAYQIAEILGGKISGNPKIKVHGFSKIENGQPKTLTFLGNLKYTKYIYRTQASIVLVNYSFSPQKKILHTLTLIHVPDVYSSLATLLKVVEKNDFKSKIGREEPVFISPDSSIPKDIYIGAFVYIGKKVCLGKHTSIYPQSYIGDNVTIGENTTIYSGVKIYENSYIGSNCIIHAGAVIGSDGFGFAKKKDHYQKIPQMGNVIIEDYVEIGANTTIDRSAIGSTIIRQGVKLDNLIQVAHHVEIGENTVIASQTGISGSVKIGKNCCIGGQVGIGGHIKIGDKVSIGAQSGIIKNVSEKQNIMGSPAIEINQYLRANVSFHNLPEISRKVNCIQKEVETLRKKNI